MLGDLVRQMKRVVAASFYFSESPKAFHSWKGLRFSKTIPVQLNG